MIFVTMTILIILLIISISNIVRYHRQCKVKDELKDVDIKWRMLLWVVVIIISIIAAITTAIACNTLLDKLGIENAWGILTSKEAINTLEAIIGTFWAVFGTILVFGMAIAGCLMVAAVILCIINIALNIYIALCIYYKCKINKLYIISLYITTVLIGVLMAFGLTSSISTIIGLI